MPFAKIKSIREVSSEDCNHLAENLVRQTAKKWRTKTAGEKMAYVILELEEPQQITGIDIGNEHSAFVEVLVGRAGCTPNDLKEILITCSFMTPSESRNSMNPNRVRCFNQEALVNTVASNKWQLVKVVCTQPFNKQVQYGLSFIKLHVSDVSTAGTAISKILVPEKFLERKFSTDLNETAPKGPNLGSFKMREDSPDSESESSNALFSRWKASSSSLARTPTPSGVPILCRSSAQDTCKLLSKPGSAALSGGEKSQILDRNRDSLMFGEESDDNIITVREQRLQKQIEIDKERLRLVNDQIKKDKEKPKGTSTGSRSPEFSEPTAELGKTGLTTDNETQKLSKKRPSSPNDRPPKKIKTDKCRQYRPFNQLLRGVVLVISGIQNPDRADLRVKAMALGAKYKSDWEPGCTHLICAFKNTPKYNQVRGKGKIVTRSWIEKCYDLKKYLPWRRYALDSTDLTNPDSDEEIWDETLASVQLDDEEPSTSQARTAGDTARVNACDLAECEDMALQTLTSGSDTEDEICRVKQKNISGQKNDNSLPKSATSPNKLLNTDVFEISTDEEDYLAEKQEKLNMVVEPSRM